MTNDTQRLLGVRKTIKSRKPNFQIQNSNDPVKRFAGRWKRPKGLQNKMRERRKGNPKYIEPGYGSPAAVRGFTHEGLVPFVVRKVSDLESAKEGYGIIIARVVGMKRRLEILKAASLKKLKVINVNADEIAKKASEIMASRKKHRQEVLKSRKVSEKKAPAQQPQKEGEIGIEGKVDDDAKKKAEKAEKDKLLTKAR